MKRSYGVVLSAYRGLVFAKDGGVRRPARLAGMMRHEFAAGVICLPPFGQILVCRWLHFQPH
ncbi:hypothetical protein CHELA1G11_14142 [Hyphomicrobiales bacterium]|nr:hypothetical protein CHELA1G2_10172 [Hyphomicrobiales bacterium]CAH1676521.1 hypothetical protein CHELA1G11_14142 [Hyphomicrobiales bacterium]